MEKKELSSIAGRMQNGTITLEDSLTVTYKLSNIFFIMWYSSCTIKYLLADFKTFAHINNLPINVCSCFIHNCPKPEATKMSFKSVNR